jgi:hypothetical protein
MRKVLIGFVFILSISIFFNTSTDVCEQAGDLNDPTPNSLSEVEV